MTELLNRPEVTPSDSDNTPVDTDPLEDMFNAPSQEQGTESSEVIADEPPLTTATSRVGRLLQRTANRLENGANRADTAGDKYDTLKEEAKVKIKGFGRAAVTRLKSAGMIGLGLGIMSAEATGRGIKKTAETAVNGAVKGGEKIGDGFIAGMNKVEAGADAAGDKIAAIKEASTARREARQAEKDERQDEKLKAKQESINDARELARIAKQKAEDRKAARHKKWADRRDALGQYGRYVKEGFTETKEAAVKGAKFAGNTIKTNAEFAKVATKELTREQKAKLGDLATRAKASGEAAVETWKSYPTR